MSDTLRQTIDSITMVVVLYKNTTVDAPFLKSYAALQLRPPLLVYDNSPQPGLRPGLPSSATYIHNDSNRGVGWCYNDAADRAAAASATWLFLFDQDTQITDTHLASFAEATQSNRNITVFCPRLIDPSGLLVSPFRVSTARGHYLGSISAGIHPIDSLAAHNTGLLVSLRTFTEAGGYNPRIMLDYSDISFFRRLRRVLSHLCVVDTSLPHQVANRVETSRERALERFRIYCRDAWFYGHEHGRKLYMMSLIMLRSLKLTARWGDLRFAACVPAFAAKRLVRHTEEPPGR